jgi:hypothetical protein
MALRPCHPDSENSVESDAHAVPAPHSPVSRTANVPVTSRVMARRRLSRLTYRRRTPPQDRLGLAVLVGAGGHHPPHAHVGAEREQHQQQPFRSTARLVISREATEANSSLKPVR